ncbi:MAG: hypothetical protein ABIQ16_12475 [Polyangiaceae bacterium]
MINLRRLFAFLAALLVLSLGASRAQAQATLKINKAGVIPSVPRTNNRNVTLLNRADCESDQSIAFPVSLTNRGTDALQAWVGTSTCTDAALRQNSAQTQCWKVADIAPGGTNPNTPTVNIPVRSLMAGYTCGTSTSTSSGTAGAASTAGSGGTTGSGGDTGAASGGDATGTTSSCILPSNKLVEGLGPEACLQSTSVAGATTLTVYIMLVNPSTLAADASDSWVASFKLVGPPPPDKFSLGIGGNLLVANFSYTTAPSDQTGNGFNLYCDPPSGRDFAVDAGLIEADASVGNTYTCGAPTSQVLVPGQLPPSTASAYYCGGSSSKSSQTANATKLVDGVAYNVAVAAFDTYENTGPLSALQCEVPQPVTGFFKAYQDSGGKAGGGFCSFSRHREPLTLFSVLGFASYLVFRRRRAA